MRNDSTNRLQTRKGGPASNVEGTREALPITPAVDIFEDEGAITVVADLPGVSAQNLAIDLIDGVLTLTANASTPDLDGEVEVLREYRQGTFQRKFNLSESIDQERIHAKLKDGVLRLRLPKVERVKARKIEVKTT